MTETALHRRRILEAIGAGSVVALTGCTGSGDESTAEADEPAQNDTQDAENDEDDGRPERLKHRVEFEVVDEDGRLQEGVVIHAEFAGPYAKSPPTDENGRAALEIPSGRRVSLHAVDSGGEAYSVKVLHADPDHERTEANGLVVLDDAFVRVELWKAGPIEVTSP